MPDLDPRAHGARGNGRTNDTAALQAAFDACAAHGGGRVVLAGGHFLTGTLRLRSGVELHLAGDARLVGLRDKDAYTGPHDAPRDRWLHALLVGEDLTDVAVTGPGTIDGRKVRDPAGEERQRGPHGLLLRRCTRVRVSDVTFRDVGNYAFLFYGCEQVAVARATFEGGWDGIHCRAVDGRPNRDLHIADCRFFTGDDSIAGSEIEDCLIERCTLNSSCNGVRLIGPARRWTLRDCRFYGPGRCPHETSGRTNMLAALCLQPSAWDKRPGALEDIHVSDVTMDNVMCALHLVTRSGNTAERIMIERVKAKLARERWTASSVEAWGGRTFKNVVLRDIDIVAPGGGSGQVVVRRPGVDVRDLPASGLYLRNLEDLTLERVRLRCLADDPRPTLRADRVTRLTQLD